MTMLIQKAGPLLVIFSVFALGVLGYAVALMYGDADVKGYYWCVDQVEALYGKYNKAKIKEAASLCKKYSGREERLVEKIVMKYT